MIIDECQKVYDNNCSRSAEDRFIDDRSLATMKRAQAEYMIYSRNIR